MHYLVNLVVCADNAIEAQNEAYNLAEELIDWHEYDSFQTTAESSRWPKCWKPFHMTSKTGKKMVQEAMDAYHVSFLETITNIRSMLEQYSDEQIFNEDFVQPEGRYISKYEFSKVSGYHDNVCRLVGSDGDRITSQRELDHYVNDLSNLNLWVVQIDCHN